MDFAAVATAQTNMQTAQTMQIGSVRRAIDQTEMVGEALVNMMQSMQVAVPSPDSRVIDIRV